MSNIAQLAISKVLHIILVRLLVTVHSNNIQAYIHYKHYIIYTETYSELQLF